MRQKKVPYTLPYSPSTIPDTADEEQRDSTVASVTQ